MSDSREQEETKLIVNSVVNILLVSNNKEENKNDNGIRIDHSATEVKLFRNTNHEGGEQNYTFDKIDEISTTSPTNNISFKQFFTNYETLFQPIQSSSISLSLDFGINSCIWLTGRHDHNSIISLPKNPLKPNNPPPDPSLFESFSSNLFNNLTGTPTPGLDHSMPDSSLPIITAKGEFRFRWVVSLNCYEVVGETLRDLMDCEGEKEGSKQGYKGFVKKLKVREHPEEGTFVDGLNQIQCSDAGELSLNMSKAFNNRTVLAVETKSTRGLNPNHVLDENLIGDAGNVIISIKIDQLLCKISENSGEEISTPKSLTSISDSRWSAINRSSTIQIVSLADTESLSFASTFGKGLKPSFSDNVKNNEKSVNLNNKTIYDSEKLEELVLKTRNYFNHLNDIKDAKDKKNVNISQSDKNQNPTKFSKTLITAASKAATSFSRVVKLLKKDKIKQEQWLRNSLDFSNEETLPIDAQTSLNPNPSPINLNPINPNQASFIPYRDALLTRLLQPILEGNYCSFVFLALLPPTGDKGSLSVETETGTGGPGRMSVAGIYGNLNLATDLREAMFSMEVYSPEKTSILSKETISNLRSSLSNTNKTTAQPPKSSKNSDIKDSTIIHPVVELQVELGFNVGESEVLSLLEVVDLVEKLISDGILVLNSGKPKSEEREAFFDADEETKKEETLSDKFWSLIGSVEGKNIFELSPRSSQKTGNNSLVDILMQLEQQREHLLKNLGGKMKSYKDNLRHFADIDYENKETNPHKQLSEEDSPPLLVLSGDVKNTKLTENLLNSVVESDTAIAPTWDRVSNISSASSDPTVFLTDSGRKKGKISAALVNNPNYNPEWKNMKKIEETNEKKERKKKESFYGETKGIDDIKTNLSVKKKGLNENSIDVLTSKSRPNSGSNPVQTNNNPLLNNLKKSNDSLPTVSTSLPGSKVKRLLKLRSSGDFPDSSGSSKPGLPPAGRRSFDGLTSLNLVSPEDSRKRDIGKGDIAIHMGVGGKNGVGDRVLSGEKKGKERKGGRRSQSFSEAEGRGVSVMEATQLLSRNTSSSRKISIVAENEAIPLQERKKLSQTEKTGFNGLMTVDSVGEIENLQGFDLLDTKEILSDKDDLEKSETLELNQNNTEKRLLKLPSIGKIKTDLNNQDDHSEITKTQSLLTLKTSVENFKENQNSRISPENEKHSNKPRNNENKPLFSHSPDRKPKKKDDIVFPVRRLRRSESEMSSEDLLMGLNDLEQRFLRAVAHGNVEEVQFCLSQGVDIGVKNAFKRDAVQIAARNGSISVLRVLIDHGASLTTRGGRKEETILHLATISGNVEMLKFINLHVKTLSKSVDTHGQTIVHIAARRAETEMLVFFYEELGLDFFQEDFDGKIPLQLVPKGCIGDPERNKKTKDFILSVYEREGVEIPKLN